MLTISHINNEDSATSYYMAGSYYIHDSSALQVGGGMSEVYHIKSEDMTVERLNYYLLGNTPQGTKLENKQNYYTNNDKIELSQTEYRKLLNKVSDYEDTNQYALLTTEQKQELSESKELLSTLEKKSRMVHRAGIDLTFSAPKGVSIMAILGDKQDIKEAHNKAVLSSMKFIEDHFMGYRSYNPETKGKKFEQGGKILFSCHRHFDSREQDPQLHSHVVVQNMILKDNGKIVSMDNRLIYFMQHLGGQIYKNELAKNLSELNYDIEIKEDKGLFDIKYDILTQKVKDFFSQRHEQIAENKIKNNAQNARDDAYSQRVTKGNKKLISEKELVEKARYRLENSSLGVKIEDFRSINIDKKVENNNIDITKILENAFSGAIAHISERNSVFTRNSLAQEILSRSMGVLRVNHVSNFIDKSIKEGTLLAPYEEDIKQYINKEHLTTPEIQKLELNTIALMKKSKDTVKPISSKSKTKELLSQYKELNAGQKSFIRGVLNTKDRVIATQGSAGVGKTYVSAKLKDIVTTKGFNVIGLAPTNTAKNELADSLGIQTHTITRFLNSYKDLLTTDDIAKDLYSDFYRSTKKKDVILVDESSFLSMQQVKDLLDITSIIGSRMVLIGDTKQLEGVKAGAGFRLLQEQGMETLKITQIIRQKNKELKKSIENIRDGNIKAGLSHIKTIELTTNELKDKFGNHASTSILDEKLVTKAINEYSKLDPTQLNAIAVPTNKLKDQVNIALRNEFIKQGKISQQYYNQTILLKKNLTEEQKCKTNNYEIGEIIQFHKNEPICNIKSNDYGVVVSKSEDLLWVVIDNVKRIYKPTLCPKSVSVYKQSTLQLSEQDKVIFTNNDKEYDITNRQVGKIISFNLNDNHKLISLNIAINNTMKEIAIDSSILQHTAYAYARTGHSLQGATVDNIISIMPSYNKLSSDRNLYVHISRVKYQSILITDDKYTLEQKLAINQESKLNAHDILSPKSQLKEQIQEKSIGATQQQTLPQPTIKPTKHHSKDYGLEL